MYSRISEMQIISWMCAFTEYLDLPDAYFYDSEIFSIYKTFQRQYLKNGSFNPLLVNEDQQILLCECMELATSVKPDAIISELKKFWQIRELFRAIGNADNLISENPNNIDNALGLIAKRNTELLLDNEKNTYDHERSVYQYTLSLEEAIKSGKTMRGHRSHLPDLDKIISGWEQGKFYLVSGLEKLGKSRFTRNLISTWLNDKKGCICCILEEDASAIHQCVFASRVGVNTDIMGTADMRPDQLAKVCREATNYMAQPMHIYAKSGMTPQNIRSTIQNQKIVFNKNGHDVVFVIVDYIQRMTVSGGTSKHEESEVIASELANIARDENVCMIGVSQMASGAEKSKGIPLHTMIRYGKPFKEAASCIITFDDPDRRGSSEEGMDVNKDYKTIIANIIQRSGMSNVNINLRAQLQYSRVENYAY